MAVTYEADYTCVISWTAGLDEGMGLVWLWGGGVALPRQPMKWAPVWVVWQNGCEGVMRILAVWKLCGLWGSHGLLVDFWQLSLWNGKDRSSAKIGPRKIFPLCSRVFCILISVWKDGGAYAPPCTQACLLSWVQWSLFDLHVMLCLGDQEILHPETRNQWFTLWHLSKSSMGCVLFNHARLIIGVWLLKPAMFI